MTNISTISLIRQLSEKERQIALARARIAARKNKLQKSSSKTGLLLDNQDDIDIDTDDAGDFMFYCCDV